ncbi:MAG: hypothetical protein LBB74_07210 [Chitinispirillales bacterium]|jgi:uncharacterized protein (TIGR02145 family)|nr:hypothetical protein [Chitinispirillales bacterium]
MKRLVVFFAAVIGAVCFVGCDWDSGANSGGGEGNNNCTSVGTCKQTRIDGKVWMAENLNIETADSWCYDNSPSGCAKYGRLYTWSAAMSACPAGWHLPSRDEWGALAIAAGGTGTYGAGGTGAVKLKSTGDWYNYENETEEYGGGTDEYGFAALPGGGRSFATLPDGRRYSYSGFSTGYYGHWWTATEYGDGHYAYIRSMLYFSDGVLEYYFDRGHAFSVRCVRN